MEYLSVEDGIFCMKEQCESKCRVHTTVAWLKGHEYRWVVILL